jgi:lysophospholipase L1-like esterase
MPPRIFFRALWFVAVSLAFARPSAAEEQAAGPPPITVVVVGDSTVATFADRPDKPGLTGWGQVLGERFTDRVKVVNHAKSGRSSKSFIAEGLWEKALAERPDYVFIQFGHNDCPGKGDRSTDPESDFRDYLNQYVDETLAAGARPILVTPMTRRVFVDGKIRTILRPYAEAMILVGKRKHVPVVDLHAASVELSDRLSDAGSADLSVTADDRTHFSPKGARAMVGLIVDVIPEAVPELVPYLKRPVDR